MEYQPFVYWVPETTLLSITSVRLFAALRLPSMILEVASNWMIPPRLGLQQLSSDLNILSSCYPRLTLMRSLLPAHKGTFYTHSLLTSGSKKQLVGDEPSVNSCVPQHCHVALHVGNFSLVVLVSLFPSRNTVAPTPTCLRIASPSFCPIPFPFPLLTPPSSLFPSLYPSSTLSSTLFFLSLMTDCHTYKALPHLIPPLTSFPASQSRPAHCCTQ